MIKLVLGGAALLCVGVLFGGSLYDTVVLAPNLRGGPQALEHGRLFLSRATPANLFRVASPLAQLLLLAAVVACWSKPGLRWLFVAALAALLLTDAITFAYHYPRLRIMFGSPLSVTPEVLDAAVREWIAANYVRVALVLGAWTATLCAVVGIARQPETWPVA